MPQFYIDSTDFSTATAIYSDALCTTPAQDGYYASCGVVRQQLNGTLLPYTECIDCKGYEKPVEGELLLDLYPDAAAAYSLRQLNTSYTGSAVRVRRASDNTEQDIGFVNMELDVASLATFCAGTDGFVVRVYDQSGNGYDAVQATTSNQPQIVSGGAVVQLSSVNVMNFASADYLQTINGVVGNVTGLSVAYVGAFKISGAGSQILFGISNGAYGGGNNWVVLRQQSGLNELVVEPNLDVVNSGTADTLLHSFFASYDGTGGSIELSVDSSNQSASQTNTSLNLSAEVDWSFIDNNGSPLLITNQYCAEFIIWPTNQSANRTGIETNINTYHTIYWDGSQPSLLDTYTGSAAAYSLRALNSDYVGPLIRVRRASDSAETDISALYDGSLNVSAIESFCSGTDGFVVRWYDQSGNSNDAVQATTSAQPQIVASGSVLVDANGNPKAVSGAAQGLVATFSSTINQPTTIFTTGLVASAASYLFDGIDATNRQARFTRFAFAGNTIAASNGAGFGLESTLYNSSSSIYRRNGSQFSTGNIGTGGLAGVTLMCRYTIAEGNSELSEFILYSADKSSDFAGIETNINAYHNIYWDGSQPALLDSYPLAAAAYSLRALNSDYVGPLVRVRRASDNTEQDINALYDGSLNVSALEAFCAGTDGYIVRAYDQSGNGNDLVQATTSAQPQIVASGSILLNSNSLPCAVFNGAQYLFNTSPTASALKYVSFVSEDNASTSVSIGAYVAQNITGVAYPNQLFYSPSSNTTVINGRSSSNVYIGVSASGYKKIVVGYYDYTGDLLNGNFDGVTATPASGLTDTSTSITRIEIGANSANSFYAKMRVQEFIIWTSGTYDIDTLADAINADYNLF